MSIAMMQATTTIIPQTATSVLLSIAPPLHSETDLITAGYKSL